MASNNASPELLIVMGSSATTDQTEHVVARLRESGCPAHDFLAAMFRRDG